MTHILGSIAALVTPMHADGQIDFPALKGLIEWHIESGSQGLVIAGTTGEAPTLSHDEYAQLVEFCVGQAAKRIPIIAGCGSNNTIHTIEKAQLAQRLGADALLVVTPYYNKPTQEGLFQHYHQLAEHVSLDIILYNVPARTGVDLAVDTVKRLMIFDQIKGIKEASGDIEKTRQLSQALAERLVIYSGCDDLNDVLCQAGCRGVISVTANVVPQAMAAFCQFMLEGDQQAALRIHNQLMPLHEVLFVEPNPIPVKWALFLLNRIDGGIRLPLTPLSSHCVEPLSQALAQCGILPVQ